MGFVCAEHYDLDRMDDEDEEAEEQDSAQGNQGGWQVPPLPQGAAITADFFRQAIAALAGNVGQAREPVPNYEVPELHESIFYCRTKCVVVNFSTSVSQRAILQIILLVKETFDKSMTCLRLQCTSHLIKV